MTGGAALTDTTRRIREIISDVISDSLSGLIEFEDLWAVYAAVFEQFKLEEPGHSEEEFEFLLAAIGNEVDRYLKHRKGEKLLFKRDKESEDDWPS